MSTKNPIIDEIKISEALEKAKALSSASLHASVREILTKAKDLKGLDLNEVALLLNVNEKDLIFEIYKTAEIIKEEIYGKRIVIFAPLYISNFCSNECVYCAFRSQNTALQRKALSQEQIANETHSLLSQGQKRILLVAGENNTEEALQYVVDSIATVYKTKTNSGDTIRRVNVNIAPLNENEFKILKAANIGTYQSFQETYHRKTYEDVHILGRKANYDWRITVFNRAMQAGIDDVGLGVLFGLADFQFEVLALLQHAKYLEREFAAGPHTVSVPRLEPAHGSVLASKPPHQVSDADFAKIIAVLRIAIPYTGIILSTRESAAMRREMFKLGVSQISAGSRTNPGGYTNNSQEKNFDQSQFSLGDHRTLDEIVFDLVKLGYIPSFCTACYRSGRTGEDFMALAKSGKIKNMCDPNALLTFQEYLQNFAADETRALGEVLIAREIAKFQPTQKELVEKFLAKIKAGKQDIYV